MILTILVVVITIVGILMVNKSIYDSFVFYLGLIFTVGGGIVTITMVLLVIFAHLGIDAQIEENRIKYEALCERQEIVDSEYEDVSKSDVIKDVAEWNKDVYSYKYWAYNPWTNWFYSKRLADSVEMIERKTK